MIDLTFFHYCPARRAYAVPRRNPQQNAQQNAQLQNAQPHNAQIQLPIHTISHARPFANPDMTSINSVDSQDSSVGSRPSSLCSNDSIFTSHNPDGTKNNTDADTPDDSEFTAIVPHPLPADHEIRAGLNTLLTGPWLVIDSCQYFNWYNFLCERGREYIEATARLTGIPVPDVLHTFELVQSLHRVQSHESMLQDGRPDFRCPHLCHFDPLTQRWVRTQTYGPNDFRENFLAAEANEMDLENSQFGPDENFYGPAGPGVGLDFIGVYFSAVARVVSLLKDMIDFGKWERRELEEDRWESRKKWEVEWRSSNDRTDGIRLGAGGWAGMVVVNGASKKGLQFIVDKANKLLTLDGPLERYLHWEEAAADTQYTHMKRMETLDKLVGLAKLDKFDASEELNTLENLEVLDIEKLEESDTENLEESDTLEKSKKSEKPEKTPRQSLVQLVKRKMCRRSKRTYTRVAEEDITASTGRTEADLIAATDKKNGIVSTGNTPTPLASHAADMAPRPLTITEILTGQMPLFESAPLPSTGMHTWKKFSAGRARDKRTFDPCFGKRYLGFRRITAFWRRNMRGAIRYRNGRRLQRSTSRSKKFWLKTGGCQQATTWRLKHVNSAKTKIRAMFGIGAPDVVSEDIKVETTALVVDANNGLEGSDVVNDKSQNGNKVDQATLEVSNTAMDFDETHAAMSQSMRQLAINVWRNSIPEEERIVVPAENYEEPDMRQVVERLAADPIVADIRAIANEIHESNAKREKREREKNVKVKVFMQMPVANEDEVAKKKRNRMAFVM